MNIHIHIHHHNHGDDKLFTELKSITQKLDIMGQKGNEIKADLQVINTGLINLGGDLDRIATQIEGGLTAEEADSVASEVKELAAKTKALADRNPETTEEPTPAPTEPTPPTDNL